MSLIAKSNGKEFAKFPLPDEGTVQAVCAGVWDLGQQINPFSDEGKTQHKAVVAWELNQLIDAPESDYHGMPYMLLKIYTVSLNENANLRKDLESWRGKPFTDEQVDAGFDIQSLYGLNCLVGISHITKGDRTYANITSILPLMKGIGKMSPVRKQDEEPPKWVKEKQALAVDADEDVPELPDDFPF